MNTFLVTVLLSCLLVAAAESASAQVKLRLVPMKGSKIKLVAESGSKVVDLDDALSGDSAIPGNPPHVYRVLFTAEKGGYLYLVANVRSHSPISDKNAPCGGDSPQSMLWIKIDKKLNDPQLENEIYASCSFNYYDTKVTVKKSGVSLKFGGQKPKELIYNNDEPEKGFFLSDLLVKTRIN